MEFIFILSFEERNKVLQFAGNPARFIKKRFSDELTELLLKLKWWDFEGTELMKILPLLCDPDLKKVACEIRKIIERRG